MTGEKPMFLTLTMKEGGTVGFGGNQTGKTIGNSSISIHNIWLLASMTLSNAIVSDISETTSFEL
ncbi:hypothetical protein MTR_7g073085 [Medicago truncatula]|uniref:Uncharacterized protein n=1 Tax=Medicago truncatula TaxID=3880 RepID=A0A072U256_MEDTR|nr:hypothetical protein MTR_7g073085 [Medicago truncatula]